MGPQHKDHILIEWNGTSVSAEDQRDTGKEIWPSIRKVIPGSAGKVPLFLLLKQVAK